MKNRASVLFRKGLMGMCSLALLVTSVAQPYCRGHWYQPDEPDNLRTLLNTKKR